MADVKKKTINFEPYYVETTNQEGHFTMKFHGDKNIIKMKFPRWWIGVIADGLHRILDEEQKQINNLRKSLTR